ncbi:metallophosphoesterase [Methyloligella sp. 2.7D]|uniref:metallophosphoesterase family protein n=1 Tax=unclassified Methyloligella TaxID=2625955 RepID=UPI00157E0C4C|nr:metallophosphoesterase [Methyloligella sp. GL2]QKP76117.1 metallophosphoesterase [Methyloligella sp. GL2]
MRLLVVSDLHYTLPQYDWVLSIADRFDVVVMAGDHLEIASPVPGRAQSAVVLKYFQKLRQKTKLLICSGNHDLNTRNAQGEKISTWLLGSKNDGLLSDGDSVTIGDTLFTLCPWWDGPIVKKQIGEQLAAAAKARKATHWVWLYHAPPVKSEVSWEATHYFGEEPVRDWIEQYQPDMVFAGHAHQAPFVQDGSWIDRIGKTWVFNTGREFIAPPAHIYIDTDAREAVWLSSAGAQMVHLDAPLSRPIPWLSEPPDWLKDVDRAPDPSPAENRPPAGE